MRTAAIVGTASVVSGSVQHHQQQKYANQEAEAQQQAYEQQAAAAPPPPPAASGGSDLDELTKLAQLHEQGILTDEEFAAKKAQILGI
jgi:Short C-terminal domain